MDISVVIPAYNEEIFISITLQSIKKWMPKKISYELIVVDHGSTDKTAMIAEREGAHVIDGKTAITIAAVRNKGADHAQGEILLFVDADISFSEEWSKSINSVVTSIKANKNQICGSHPETPENSNRIVRNWFNPKSNESSPNYINSCHLIIHKDLFHKIGKFPEKMETSEDVTLCINAKKEGAIIKAFPELPITHQGAPRTLIEFIKSEAWHGRSDWSSLSTIANSKAPITTILFILLHTSLFFSVVYSSIYETVAIIMTIILLCATSSYFKFIKHGIFYAVGNTLTFYLYFLGRSFSLASYALNKNSAKRQRH